MSLLESLEESIVEIKSIMIAYATDGRTDDQPAQYQRCYIDLDILIERAGYQNPNPYKTIEAFWRDCGGTWAERRDLVSGIYADLIFEIGRKVRGKRDPRNWGAANAALSDALSPVRIQWLKAKNFIFEAQPDYENSIKESVNSIESCLMILLNEPKRTLGQLVKDPRIDPDISKIIGKAYGLCSNKDFVRHGGTSNQPIGQHEAEFFLNLAATAIIYIKAKLG